MHYLLTIEFTSDSQMAVDSLCVTIAQVAPFMVDNVTVVLDHTESGASQEYRSMDLGGH